MCLVLNSRSESSTMTGRSLPPQNGWFVVCVCVCVFSPKCSFTSLQNDSVLSLFSPFYIHCTYNVCAVKIGSCIYMYIVCVLHVHVHVYSCVHCISGLRIFRTVQ